MGERQFIFLMGQVDGSELKTIIVSWKRLLLYISLFVLFFILTAFFIGHGLVGIEMNYRSRQIFQENQVLKSSLDTWERRFSEMQVTVDDLSKRNRQIRTTASLSSPDVEFGMGGPESSVRSGLFDIPRLQDMELDLARLEAELNWVKQSTVEIENQMETKYKEIAHYPSIRPVKGGWVTSSYGIRKDPFTGMNEMHPGLDIALKPGTEVVATGAGIVKRVNQKVIKNKSYGKYIVIDHGFGYETLYGHLSEIFVKQGQKIKRWDLIGLSGNTGKSTAPHLHYGVYFNSDSKNPMNFILD